MALDAGAFSAGGCAVPALEVPHKGGRTFGYRIEADGVSLAYLPDHHLAANERLGLELTRGVDVSCHGAMFDDSERVIAHAHGQEPDPVVRTPDLREAFPWKGVLYACSTPAGVPS